MQIWLWKRSRNTNLNKVVDTRCVKLEATYTLVIFSYPTYPKRTHVLRTIKWSENLSTEND